MPKVWNIRDKNTPKEAIYVGRPSKWGNPFKLRYDTTEERLEVVFNYKNYIERKLLDKELDIKELQGRDLSCWCAPKHCHADILLELANK
jgi:hypothetical protein